MTAMRGLRVAAANLADMDRLERIRSRPAMVIGACAAIAGGCAVVGVTDAHAAARATTLSLVALPAPVTTVDLGPAGASPGDLHVFDGTVNDTSGQRAGRVIGTQTDIRGESGAETVNGSITYELATGQIVIGGLSQYPVSGAAGTRAGRTYTRPILGGSGAYADAHGVQTAERRADGSYALRFSMKLPSTAAPTTVAVRAVRAFVVPLDLPPVGSSPGDFRAVLGDLVAPDGSPDGIVRGSQTTIAVDATDLTVQSQLNYELPDGELVVGGLSVQKADGSDLVPGRTFVRPVLGGTGRYAGAGGELTSVLSADSTVYDHRFSLTGVGSLTTAQTVRFFSRKPSPVTVDVGVPGKTAGDVYVIASTLSDAHGRTIGRVRGTQTSLAVENGAETVAVDATYELPFGSVVVGGISQYPVDSAGNVVGKTFVRSVLGGTGRYEGAHGTMTTLRMPDGSYQQTLRFVR
jgi:hypothetical protein